MSNVDTLTQRVRLKRRITRKKNAFTQMPSSSVNPSPLENVNFISRIFHNWLTSLLTKSRKQGTLYVNDLYDPPTYLDSIKWTDKLENNWFDEMKHCPENPSLIRATLRTIGWGMILNGLILIPNELIRIVQPLLLISLMKFFEPCSTMPAWQAWLLLITIVIVLFFISCLFNEYVIRCLTCGLQMRLAYTGLIYRKMLRLSSHAMNNLSSGEITNLLANDANKIEVAHTFFNYLWLAPLQITLAIWLFWYFVKYVALMAIGYTLLLLLLQPLFSRLFVLLRTNILKITDERVKIMSEIIKSMRIVKIYCWESSFDQNIRHVRKREIIQTILYTTFNSINAVLSHSYINITLLLVYGTLWWLNMRFDSRLFVISYGLLIYIRNSAMNNFSMGLREIINYRAAQKRIRRFLLLGESERDNRLKSSSTLQLSNHQDQTMHENVTKRVPKVICNLKNAKWEQAGTFSLKNIVFAAHPGDLICVIGPVGSGKSSLLQTLTGEIPWFDGKVRLYGSFCYVPQEPWIFSSTIKNNILFGKEYNHKLFQRVINATALDTDFIQLPHGANTLVGDQGVMLSGGQKARVNMARALYRDADIYLLDDPLSAVDVKVSKHLFDKSIKSYLRDKICILVTHQIQFLQDARKIIVLNNGAMVQIGAYAELLSSSTAFARLLEDINQYQREQMQQATTISRRMSKINSISLENEDEEDIEPLPTDMETKQKGTVKWHVYISYLQAGIGTVLGVSLILIVFAAHQTLHMYSNRWLAEWSDEESHRFRVNNNCTNGFTQKMKRIHSMNQIEWNEHRAERFHWYSILVLLVVLFTILRIVISRLICLNAARVLHNKMFRRIIRSPITFFDMNPVGRILNRFTSDVATMDDSLTLTVSDFLTSLSSVLGVVILVGLLNPWSFIPAAIAGIAMLVLRYQFAPGSRDLKRLAGTTRSPVYSYLTSSIHGLKVIRSYHAERMCCDEFFRYLQDNTRVTFLINVLEIWAAQRFDWISIIFITLVTLFAIVARITQQQFSATDIALTLSLSVNLMSLLQWTIRQSVEVETQMTSVERVLEYCELDQEPPAQLPPKYRPPINWPSHGHITFNNVCMSHSKDPDAPLALNHITLTIQPAEKIGIVGRTGSGKSSLIQTLFRMGTLVDGEIKIDDIDISTVGLDDVRRRISIIPQDPVLFTGTMRSNLDRFGDYSDVEIWHALEQVQLKRLVSDVMSNGLHSIVSESGSNLSVGQKQLVCLARAILKKSKILMIDEATANVDNATDELIQRAIREQFKECTVLTVAHRLRTVIDSDRIMVLGNGELLEFDSPGALLSHSESQFASIVAQTGAAEAEHLRLLARVALKKVKSTDSKLNDDKSDELLSDNTENDPLIQ